MITGELSLSLFWNKSHSFFFYICIVFSYPTVHLSKPLNFPHFLISLPLGVESSAVEQHINFRIRTSKQTNHSDYYCLGKAASISVAQTEYKLTKYKFMQLHIVISVGFKAVLVVFVVVVFVVALKSWFYKVEQNLKRKYI